MLHVLSRGRYFCPHEGESVRAQSQLNSFSQAENLTFLDLKQVSFGGPANHGEVTNYSCRAAARCRLATPLSRFPFKKRGTRRVFCHIVPGRIVYCPTHRAVRHGPGESSYRRAVRPTSGVGERRSPDGRCVLYAGRGPVVLPLSRSPSTDCSIDVRVPFILITVGARWLCSCWVTFFYYN